MDKLKNLQDKIDYVLDNNDAVFALAAGTNFLLTYTKRTYIDQLYTTFLLF